MQFPGLNIMSTYRNFHMNKNIEVFRGSLHAASGVLKQKLNLVSLKTV